jgi:hypothetical protein
MSADTIRLYISRLPDDDAVVRFDRTCRTVHALNRFAASEAAYEAGR